MKTNLAKAGLINLAETVLEDSPKYISFAEGIDSKLEQVPVPDINGQVRCSECLSYDHWVHVDHDFSDSDEFAKEVRYRCMAWINDVYGDGIHRCENDTTIYLDKNNGPVLKVSHD